MKERTRARKKRIFERAVIDEQERVRGLAAKRVTATDESDARFTRIFVGYSAAEIIFIS